MNPPRFQEDDELYEEKAYNQEKFARGQKSHTVYSSITTGRTDEGCRARSSAYRPKLSSAPSSPLSLVAPPPGLGDEIGISAILAQGVDRESEITIKSGRSWRQDQVKSEEVMIQNLEKNPTTICIDSGAGESVCPVDFFPDYETHETEKVGNLYRAAGGQELRNVGEKRPKLKIGGVPASRSCQGTSQVRKPLAVAAKISANGNRIVLEDENSLSCIENKATGAKIPLRIENGV